MGGGGEGGDICRAAAEQRGEEEIPIYIHTYCILAANGMEGNSCWGGGGGGIRENKKKQSMFFTPPPPNRINKPL